MIRIHRHTHTSAPSAASASIRSSTEDQVKNQNYTDRSFHYRKKSLVLQSKSDVLNRNRIYQTLTLPLACSRKIRTLFLLWTSTCPDLISVSNTTRDVHLSTTPARRPAMNVLCPLLTRQSLPAHDLPVLVPQNFLPTDTTRPNSLPTPRPHKTGPCPPSSPPTACRARCTSRNSLCM